jgi:NADH-quinone oxidoreductase subunit G/NADP-reducing hydrogenase subunit HndD
MFGMEPGERVTGKLASAFRLLGFDDVFDTNWAADLTIIEEGTELLGRLKEAFTGGDGILPMITSCSPGWIKYIEHTYPYELGHLSSCKSPHMMLGAVAKSYYANKLGIPAKDMFVVSVMPCTAKKTEISRPEMRLNGLANVDAVITTRELGEMIKEAGIDFANLPDGKFDEPLGISTGAADIFGLTGGVMEAALRTVYELVTGRELPFENLHVTPIIGLDSIKEAAILVEKTLTDYEFLEGKEIKVAVASGLKNADVLMKQIAAGQSPYHFVEVMGCPGGCITGGGQPRSKDPDVRKKRLQALYEEDEGKTLRKSHENPAITAIYSEFLGKPNGYFAHELLHTHYTRRGKYNELTDETYSVKIREPEKQAETPDEKPAAQKTERLVPKHSREELESVRVLTLEAENMKLKGELNQAQEMLDILRMVVADYAERK